jgi:hypothetical protein
MNGISAHDSKLFSPSPYGLSECFQPTILVAIPTFAILFHLSVGADEGKHLGENHRKLVIPAGYGKGSAKEVARHEGGQPRMTDWIIEFPLWPNRLLHA